MRTKVARKVNRAFSAGHLGSTSPGALPQGSEMNGALFGAKKPICAPHLLMQAMCDQPACAFQKLSIFIAEGIQFIALGIEHTKNVAMIVTHRHDNL